MVRGREMWEGGLGEWGGDGLDGWGVDGWFGSARCGAWDMHGSARFGVGSMR